MFKKNAVIASAVSKYPIILSLILSLIVTIIYSESLTADFVMWDDDWFIYHNPKLGILNLQNLWSILIDNTVSSSFYTPLTGLRWSITYTFWGLNPFAYHFGNLLFHTLNTVLLFLFLRKLIMMTIEKKLLPEITQWRIDTVAALSTLLWSLHPLSVEPVASTAAGAHVQAIFFMLLSLMGYLRYNENKMRYRHWLTISVVCYSASILSQPITLALPAVLIALDVYPLKRIAVVSGWWKSPEAKHQIFEKIPFVLVALVVCTVNIFLIVEGSEGKPFRPYVSLAEFDLLNHFMQATYILAYYIWRPFYPVNLSPVYTTFLSFEPLSISLILSAFFVITISIVLFIFRKKSNPIFTLWCCYIILLIPIFGFFEHANAHCDRYSLIPSMCLSTFIAFGLTNFIKNKYWRSCSLSLLLIPVIILGWLSFNQIKIWHNSESLFSHTIKILGNDPYRQDIYWRLGKYLYEQDKKEQAIINFNKTIEINPYHPMAHVYLAVIEYNNNNLVKTIYHLQNLLIAEPNNFMAHYWLSKLFDKLNRKEESAYHLKRAIDLKRSN